MIVIFNKLKRDKPVFMNLTNHMFALHRMLYSFVQHQRNNKDNDHLFVTYFVAGLSHPVVGVKVSNIRLTAYN